MHAVVLGLTFLLGQPDGVPPEDIWPQWRGPTHDSVSPNPNLPTKWSTTENVIWKKTLPGWGNSVPAIWKDALFVTSQDKDRLLLFRMDRVKGDIVWEREVAKGKILGKETKGGFKAEHNMASPSPITDGKHVWVHFATGELACYDYAGERIWAINLVEKYGKYTI